VLGGASRKCERFNIKGNIWGGDMPLLPWDLAASLVIPVQYRVIKTTLYYQQMRRKHGDGDIDDNDPMSHFDTILLIIGGRYQRLAGNNADSLIYSPTYRRYITYHLSCPNSGVNILSQYNSCITPNGSLFVTDHQKQHRRNGFNERAPHQCWLLPYQCIIDGITDVMSSLLSLSDQLVSTPCLSSHTSYQHEIMPPSKWLRLADLPSNTGRVISVSS
jgi:hypothetical protein